MTYYDNKGQGPKATPEQQQLAAKEAATDYDLGKSLDHPYLKAKGVQRHNSRVALNGDLLIPGINLRGETQIVQRIWEEKDGSFTKRFPKHSKKRGTYSLLGNLSTDTPQRIGLCEGFATGASLHEALSIPILVCWDVWNLRHTAPLLKEKYPQAEIIIFADNDLFTEGNPGKTVAKKLGQDLSLKVIFPIFKPDDLKSKDQSDVNDMHRLYGLSGVRLQYENEKNGGAQDLPLLLRPITAYDLMRSPEENYSWIIDGILAEGSLNLFAANSTAGKSVLMRQAAVCVARGEPFLERETKKGKVLWLAMEEPKKYIRMHLDKILQNEDTQKNIEFLFPEDFQEYVYRAGQRGFKKTYMDALKAFCKKYKPSLVIIDTLIYFTPIEKTSDYGIVSRELAPYRAIARETGCCLLLAHHMNKQGKKGEEREGMVRVMGSEAFNAAVDVTVGLEVDKEENRWIWAKGRTDRAWPKLRLHWDTERWWGTLGGTKKSEEQAKRNASLKRALAGVREKDAITYTALRDKVSVGKEVLNALLEAAKSEPWLGVKTNPKNKNSKVFYEKLYEAGQVKKDAQY